MALWDEWLIEPGINSIASLALGTVTDWSNSDVQNRLSELDFKGKDWVEQTAAELNQNGASNGYTYVTKFAAK